MKIINAIVDFLKNNYEFERKVLIKEVEKLANRDFE